MSPPELKISVSVFKAKALGLFEKVGRGETRVTVTKHGKPLAQVIPFAKKDSQKNYKPGGLASTLLHEEDIVSPLGADMWGATQE